MYDLVDDAFEKKDLAADKPEIVAKMKAALETWPGTECHNLFCRCKTAFAAC